MLRNFVKCLEVVRLGLTCKMEKGERAKIRLLILVDKRYSFFIADSLITELLRRDYEITVNTTNGSRLPSYSDMEKFDLIYFAKFSPPIWDDINILFHRTKTPVIYAFYAPSLIFNPYRLQNYVHNAISLIKLAYIKIAKPVVALHVLNASEYKLLNSLGFRCYYVPLGIDTETFKPRSKTDRFNVVFVSPKYQKGVDMLMKIVSKVLRKAPDLKFTLIGRGFLSHYFTSLKRVFGDNVEVCEWLPQRDIAKLFSSSHILLFPSRYESFGLVVLEALSSGMPVVCYDILGTPKNVVKKHGTGVVANPFNVDEIVNGVLDYYEMLKNQPEEFKRLSIKCRNLALEYDWSVIADLFDKMFSCVYKEVT
jgi:glycosyltransferase involved in cell wall biosynthesis